MISKSWSGSNRTCKACFELSSDRFETGREFPHLLLLFSLMMVGDAHWTALKIMLDDALLLLSMAL